MKFLRLVPVMSLLAALDCIPIGFKDAEKGKAVDIGMDMNGARQSLMGPTSTASIKSDWSAMLESSRILEEYQIEIDVDKYHTSHLNTIREQIDHLNTIQNLLEHVFGKPEVPLQNSLVEPQRVWYNADNSLVEHFKRSAWDLISSTKVILDPEEIPEGLHHIQVVFNNCALQTIELICRYNLAPPELNQTIQNSLKSKEGLEWFSHASANIFRASTKFSNHHSCAPYSKIHLKHHFLLSHFNHIFQDLEKKEQDWILFHYLSVQMGLILNDEAFNNEYITIAQQDKSWSLLVRFTRKLKNLLLKELEGGNQEGSSRRFLMDVRDDLVEMAKVYINPLMHVTVENSSPEAHGMCTIIVLQFLHQQLGMKYMNSEILGDKVGINKVEFEQKFGLLELAYNIQMWKNMLLDYSHNMSESSSKGPKVKNITTRAEKEEMKQFYWKKFQESINLYKEWKLRQFETDNSWKEKIERNQFYKELMDALDKESKGLWKVYEDVNSMLQL